MTLNQILSVENLGLLADLNLSLLFMEILLFGSSLFLMLLILVQRGKGGGLTGALGGMGGQSAFGSKAGDAFTKITVVTAVVWIMLCMVTIAAFNPPPAPKQTKNDDATISSMMGDGDDEADGADTETGGADTETDGAETGAVGENGFSDEGKDSDEAADGDSDNETSAANNEPESSDSDDN